MLSLNRRTILIVMILLLTLTSIILIGTIAYKPSIHDAEVSDLCGIYGLGEVLSVRVVSFIDANPNADINDLLDVDGIGSYRLKLIKREFR